MKRLLRNLWFAEDGPTAVEYAVLLAMLMGAFFSTVQLLGQATKDSIDHSSEKIDESFSAAGLGN